MRLVRYMLPAVLAVGLAAGCGQPNTGTRPANSAPTATAATGPAPTPTPAPTPVAEPKVELKEISAAGFEEAVRGLKGKVVLVDAWFLG